MQLHWPMHMHMKVRGWHWLSSCIALHLKTVSLTKPELTISARLADQRIPVILCLQTHCLDYRQLTTPSIYVGSGGLSTDPHDYTAGTVHRGIFPDPTKLVFMEWSSQGHFALFPRNPPFMLRSASVKEILLMRNKSIFSIIWGYCTCNKELMWQFKACLFIF